MTRAFTESVVEQAALAWLESTVWKVAHGRVIAPDTPGTERARYAEVARNRALHRLLRPDVMLFAHGLPLALQELENAADGASIRSFVQKRLGAARRAG